MSSSTSLLCTEPREVQEEQEAVNEVVDINKTNQILPKLASLSLNSTVSSSVISAQYPVPVFAQDLPDTTQVEPQIQDIPRGTTGQYPQKLKGLINQQVISKEKISKTKDGNQQQQAVQEGEDERVVLEDFTQCSKSHLWKLMMSFYDRKGVDSWSEGIVPFFITSNRFIGSAYAKVVRGFIKDCLENQKNILKNTLQKNILFINQDDPLYIVELGAGSGKFTYFMLQALVDMEEVLDLPLQNIKYIMTDFTEQNFNFWKNHPNLKEFFDRGLLDCGLFDAVADKEIKLYFSGKTLKSGEVANPMIIVANYLFDTLCHDVFQISDNIIKEGLISVGSKGKLSFKKVTNHQKKKPISLSTTGNTEEMTQKARSEENRDDTTKSDDSTFDAVTEVSKDINQKEALVEPDPLDPDIIKRFANKYKYVSIENDYHQYYNYEKDPENNSKDDEEHLANILRWYHAYFGTNLKTNASILYPIGALRAIRKLSNLTNGRLLIISGDKGNNNPKQFVGLVNPHLAIHGSFSVMVNYHAIGLYFLSRGGFSLHNPQEDASLKVSCFLLTGNDPNSSVEENIGSIGKKELTNPINEEKNAEKAKEQKFTENEKTLYYDTEAKIEQISTNLVNKGEVRLENRNSMEILSKEKTEDLRCIFEVGGNVDLESAVRAKDYPHLVYEFQNEIESFGPNDFFVLQKTLKEDIANPSLRTIIALLKLSDWDPDIFYKFRDPILNQAPMAGAKLKNDLIRGIPRIWTNYFMLDKDKDIAFEIGRFYYGIKEFHLALQYYGKSAIDIGEHHVTFHNMGLCYYSISNLEKALEYFSKALKINKKYEKARSWHEKVCTELGMKNSTDNEPLAPLRSTSISSTPLLKQDSRPLAQGVIQQVQRSDSQQEGGPATSTIESADHTR